MNYLLDTCVLSELIKIKPNQNLLHWFLSINSNQAFVSCLTIGEIKRGIEKLNPSNKKKKLSAWLLTIKNDYAEHILEIDMETASFWGQITAKAEIKGKTSSSIDSLIAATAIKHNLVLVTRNEKDFQNLPTKILNPWIT